MKIKVKIGALNNCFKITPCVQIAYSQYSHIEGFSIEFIWGKWGAGCNFYDFNFNKFRQFIDLGAFIYFKL